MKDGWIYTFIVTDKAVVNDFKEGNIYYSSEDDDSCIYYSRTKSNELRVVCYSCTRRKAEFLMNKYNGRKLRLLDKFTFDICWRFFRNK